MNAYLLSKKHSNDLQMLSRVKISEVGCLRKKYIVSEQGFTIEFYHKVMQTELQTV